MKNLAEKKKWYSVPSYKLFKYLLDVDFITVILYSALNKNRVDVFV